MQWYKHPAYPVSATPTGFLHATPCQQKAYESLPLVPKSPKDGCNATRRRGTVGPHKKRYGQPIRKNHPTPNVLSPSPTGTRGIAIYPKMTVPSKNYLE